MVGFSQHAQQPKWFTTAPVYAVEALQKRLGWTADSTDLYEINEAFAVVAMAAITDLKLDNARVNVNGGAVLVG